GGADGVGARGVQVQVAEGSDAAHRAHGGGAGTGEGARAGGTDGHAGGARGQVVELIHDLHGRGRADGRARRGCGRLLAEEQVIGSGRGDREAGRGGAGQAG